MQILSATGLHRKSGGAEWRDLRFSGPFVEMFLDRGIMGLWLAQDDENGSFSYYCPLEALPSPLSSRPERSGVERSAVQRSPPGNVFERLR
jgi:hypothetical protein